MNESPADPPNQRWLTFDEMLSLLPPPNSWRTPGDDYDGFFQAAVEAYDLTNGQSLLAKSQPLAFNELLTVEYVGEGSGDDGCICYGFLFKGPDFDAFIWIEDDLRRARLVWRGDEEAYLRTGLMLRMFEEQTLSHLR
ncbi:hypothetical protein [Brevundimonas sp.]|jgi:hypothetical protein|uniref:hypothetical protein n=1 Tax=Brevundimonas sp. TaxID=1871086 RepID=UPI0025BB1352|nr:hypothetical protein [Brevundimonas sp.]